MTEIRRRTARRLLAAVCLIGCANLITGCFPHTRYEYTVANQTTYDPWMTGANRTITGSEEPNLSTGAGSYRSIDEKNGVKYP